MVIVLKKYIKSKPSTLKIHIFPHKLLKFFSKLQLIKLVYPLIEITNKTFDS